MEKEVYFGNAWENQYGLNVSINLEKLKQLPVDSYGNIKLFVGKRKEVDAKSKATHWVKESKPFVKKDVNAENFDLGNTSYDDSNPLPF